MRAASLALEQSYNCPTASDIVNLKDQGTVSISEKTSFRKIS